MDRTNRTSLYIPLFSKSILAEIPKAIKIPSKHLSAEWTKIPIKGIRESPKTPGGKSPLINPESMVLMGDYLIILAFDGKDRENEVRTLKRNPHLLAVDLRDLSVQQVRIEKWGEKNPDSQDPTYLLQKYDENQIIVFDVSKNTPSERYRCSHMLTIESLRPLSVKCKHLDMKREEEEEECKKNDVKISKDCVYVIDRDSGTSLWCFDPKNQTWKGCKTVGELPGSGTMSFIFKDNLYAYDSSSNLSMLNSDTMEWKSCHQKFGYADDITLKLAGDIYNEHLVVFFRNGSSRYDEGWNQQLRCFNLHTNSWKSFHVKPSGPYHFVSKLIIDKNSLWMVGGSKEGDLWLATYNLDNLGLGAPMMSHADQDVKALFMNEKGSDVKFKVEGQIIPAHKEVLIEKSRFFAGLFRSGMAETKQDMIEINDCDFATFQEFLRYLYCNEIKPDDARTVFKLIDFSDKYVQDDLKNRCFFYLKTNINSKTVFTIFEEAYAKNMQNLVTWCINHLRAKITLEFIPEIIQPQILKHSLELNDEVLNWILENYSEIYEKRNQCMRVCEEFLAQNIKKETIVKLSQFVAGESGRKNFIFRKSYKLGERAPPEPDQGEIDKIFEQETKMLKERVISFMQENWEEMNKEEAEKAFPRKLFRDMISYMLKAQNLGEKKDFEEIKQDDFEEKVEDEAARGRKRKEPVQNENVHVEKPELKKTKK